MATRQVLAEYSTSTRSGAEAHTSCLFLNKNNVYLITGFDLLFQTKRERSRNNVGLRSEVLQVTADERCTRTVIYLSVNSSLSLWHEKCRETSSDNHAAVVRRVDVMSTQEDQAFLLQNWLVGTNL